MWDTDEQLSSHGYKFEFSYGETGWAWAEHRVYTKDGRVFRLYDSGCSCTSFGDQWHTVDEAIGDLAEVTNTPSFHELTEQRGYDSWDDSNETVQQQYRELFSELARRN